MEDKIIVTNRQILLKKYGNKGLAVIRRALAMLAAADKKRGIKSRVVYIDDKSSMKRFRGKPVVNAADHRENKEAIDSVFKFFNPHYLMILGAPDVVPYQDLDNPAYSPPDDDDLHAFGDIPYACDASYSRDPACFVGPTRVIGRLPDLVNAREPTYLISLLKTVTNYNSKSVEDYKGYLGLSAYKWKGSSRLSIRKLFGNIDNLLLVPPSGPRYSKVQIGNRVHFINCHGAPSSPEFYGERNKKYPKSLTTKSIRGEIREGTVATAECCYGAELYDAITLSKDMPICQSYLEQGGYGYFGSTTIAYGDRDDNASADLICQFFLRSVLDGASVGRAALIASQQFVANTHQMDPMDLKTLAQFYLLGDPSIHPIAKPSATIIPKNVSSTEAERFFRAERRQKLKMSGDFLKKTKPTASKQVVLGKLSLTTRIALNGMVKQAGLSRKQTFKAFAVKQPAGLELVNAKVKAVPSRYLLAIGTAHGKGTERIKRGVAVVAKELNGLIVGYRIYQQR